jgi:hypothetical protein
VFWLSFVSDFMAQFRRDYFELKRAEAVDLADPRSFAVHRKTSVLSRPECRPRKAFCTSHSNRNCGECKKKKVLAQKRRRQRTLGMDLLANDYHGFHWIDTKVNEFQTLNVAGQGLQTSPAIEFHNSGVFQDNRLFFPEMTLSRPILVTRQAGMYRKLAKERKETGKDPLLHVLSSKRREDFEDNERFMPVLHALPTEREENLGRFENNRLPSLHAMQEERKESFKEKFPLPVSNTVEGGGPSEMKILESTKRGKRRINVVLPRISQE